MGVVGKERQLCPCHKKCQDFQKLIELEDLVVYSHRNNAECGKKGAGVENSSQYVFILYNKKDAKITTADLLSESGKKYISCPRCRQTFKHVQELMQDVKSIDKKTIMGICDHCHKVTQTTKNPFCACEEIVKKFISVKGKPKGDIERHVNTWLLKMRHLEDSRSKTKVIKTDTFSKLQISQDLDLPAPKHQPEIQQMFHSDKHFLSDDTDNESETDSKDAQTVTFTHPIEPVETFLPDALHQGEKTYKIVPEMMAVDSETISHEKYVSVKELPRPSLKDRKEDELFKDDIPSMEAIEALKRRHDLSLRQMMRSKKDSDVLVTKRPYVQEIPKHAPREEQKPTSKYHVDFKMDTKMSELTRPTHDIVPSDRSVTYGSTSKKEFQDFKLGKVDKHHRYQMKKGVDDTGERPKKTAPLERKANKPDKYLMKSKSGPTETVKREYSFSFPKEITKKEKKIKLHVTSSQLIKDTQEKFRLKAENEKKRKEEETQRKLEQKQQKALAREKIKLEAKETKRQITENQKYVEEQKRLAEEKRSAEEKRLAEERRVAEEKRLAEEKDLKRKNKDKKQIPETDRLEVDENLDQKYAETQNKLTKDKNKYVKDLGIVKDLVSLREDVGKIKKDKKPETKPDVDQKSEHKEEDEQKTKAVELLQAIKDQKANKFKTKQMETKLEKAEQGKRQRDKKKRDSSAEIKVSLSKIQKQMKKDQTDISEKKQGVILKSEQEPKRKPAQEESPKGKDRKGIDLEELKNLQAQHLKDRAEALKKKQQQEYEEQKAKAKEAERKAKEKELKIKDIKIKKGDSLEALRLVRIKQAAAMKPGDIDPELLHDHKCKHAHGLRDFCPLCINSELELEVLSLDERKNRKKKKIMDIILGENIVKQMPQQDETKELENVPILFQKDFYIEEDRQPNELEQTIPKQIKPVEKETNGKPINTKGILHYALSDRTFIEKGWTVLPTEKIMRKMNVYRMRPAHPEFDWFEHNKKKRLMTYDTNERLAEFDDNGRGRLYYRNGRLALDYYDAEETNAQQRFVIYSSGEPDERGRTHPITILATFDYLGNGIVFDHAGKIRLKYNQTEGVVLDRGIGPVSHWKWHTLNDPPVLQQVMIDTQMAHKDPNILKLGSANEQKTRPDNEEMLAIEFDNFIKEKSKKLSQQFKPFQIKMKALKINEHFSLRVLDQATVYLIFRDGSTNVKFNIGMILDHQEIVDTNTAEVGEVSNSLELFPARTDSLAALQRSVAYAQRYERQQTERERRLRPPEPCASADQLTAAASRPMRPPFRAAPSVSSTSTGCCSRKPTTNNLYYNTRLVL